MITLKEALARTIRSGTSSRKQEGDASGGRTPVLGRPRVAVPEPAPEPSPPKPEPDTTKTKAFSALAVRDRVTIMLLFDQIITEEQVAQVWELWHQEYRGDLRTPLWRLLTLIPGLDSELILAEAARVFKIEQVSLSSRVVLPMLQNLVNHVPKSLWDRMMALRLLPLNETEQRSKHRKKLVFVSHDPTHPEVIELLGEMGIVSFELRYAPEHEIVDMMARAFPEEFKKLKREVDRERERFVKIRQIKEEGRANAPKIEPEQEVVALPEDNAGAPLLNTSSVITYFEELLVGVVRSGASGLCLVPSTKASTEVYTLIENTLSQWCVIDHISPKLLLATIKSAIIRANISVEEGNQHHEIERWIDGKRVRFRISALPFGKNLDRQSLVFRAIE